MDSKIQNETLLKIHKHLYSRGINNLIHTPQGIFSIKVMMDSSKYCDLGKFQAIVMMPKKKSILNKLDSISIVYHYDTLEGKITRQATNVQFIWGAVIYESEGAFKETLIKKFGKDWETTLYNKK